MNSLELLRSKITQTNPQQLRALVADCTYSERRVLVDSCAMQATGEKTNRIAQQLLEKIERTNLPAAEITRRIDCRSKLTHLERKILWLLDKIARCLGVLTTRETVILIKKTLLADENSSAQKVSQTRVEAILNAEKMSSSTDSVKLADILEQHGYGPEVYDCRFEDSSLFQGVDLRGITFKNCRFDWSHFSDTNLQQVAFQSCELANVSFLNSEIAECTFTNCELQEVMFTGGQLEAVQFSLCVLAGCSFEDATINRSTLTNVTMPGTHFLQATVRESSIENCTLTDAVFFDTLAHFTVDTSSQDTAHLTRPIAAILVHPECRGISTPKAYMRLDQAAHTIPLRIALQAQKTNPRQVNQEVQEALSDIDDTQRPIPPQLLDKIKASSSHYQQSGAILKKAETLAGVVDCFFLTGGEDVPPKLYGQEEEPSTDWGNDYRRSLLELGIIQQAFQKGIPMMAVCRGFQIASIYFGAKLVQDIGLHEEVQRFELVDRQANGLYHEVMARPLRSAVYHHQAVTQEQGPTEYLEAAVIHQDQIKAAEPSVSGASPMMLLQFHPELYKTKTADSIEREIIDRALDLTVSNRNEKFWKLLSDSAQAHRGKKQLLASIATGIATSSR